MGELRLPPCTSPMQISQCMTCFVNVVLTKESDPLHSDGRQHLDCLFALGEKLQI
jgi:hypothetical protein